MRRRPLLLLVAALTGPAAALAAPPRPLTVFAASDLAAAFEELLPAFERSAGAKVTPVVGSTGQLARQIEQGAPADVFFAANVAFVDGLAAAGAVIPESRVLYARGRIVLATRRADGPPLARLADLLGPSVRRVAIANPDHAPYGQAAKEALATAGVWDAVRPKLVYGETVRQALQFLESGAVEAAIVALSIAGAPGVRHTLLDASLHRPLDQAAAVTTRAADPELARRLLAFVTGPEGRAILARYGFVPPRLDRS